MDIENKRFGRLIVIKKVKIENTKNSKWLCLCDCGNQTIVFRQALVREYTKSCGCFHKEISRDANIKHGFIHKYKKGKSKNLRFYAIWSGMRNRCNNPNNRNYRYYGLQGVKVCKRWDSFQNFFYDMWEPYQEHLKKYGIKNTTIDRINTYGDYSSKNCRWATHFEQVHNRKISLHSIKVDN